MMPCRPINRFIKTYPTNKHIDYAYYLRGLINFDRTSGVIERYIGRGGSEAAATKATTCSRSTTSPSCRGASPTAPTPPTRASA